jgi:hypothetical protein
MSAGSAGSDRYDVDTADGMPLGEDLIVEAVPAPGDPLKNRVPK